MSLLKITLFFCAVTSFIVVDLTFAVTADQCGVNLCNGTLAEGLNISYTSFEKVENQHITDSEQWSFVEVSGTQNEREQKCAKFCHDHRLAGGGQDFCKRAILSSYDPVNPSKCHYDNYTYYSVEKQSWNVTYTEKVGSTVFYIKNDFCERRLCEDAQSYCEPNFDNGGGSCVCNGEHQGKYCDTWDYKQKLTMLWSFDTNSLFDEISGIEGGISDGCEIVHAIQRKSYVLALKVIGKKFWVKRDDKERCMYSINLAQSCLNGYTFMFWTRMLSTSHPTYNMFMLPSTGGIGVYFQTHSTSGYIKVIHRTTVADYRCEPTIHVKDVYRKWIFVAISYHHASDEITAFMNGQRFQDCTKVVQTTVDRGNAVVKFLSKSILMVDDIMYKESSSTFEEIERYYLATKK